MVKKNICLFSLLKNYFIDNCSCELYFLLARTHKTTLVSEVLGVQPSPPPLSTLLIVRYDFDVFARIFLSNCRAVRSPTALIDKNKNVARTFYTSVSTPNNRVLSRQKSVQVTAKAKSRRQSFFYVKQRRGGVLSGKTHVGCHRRTA